MRQFLVNLFEKIYDHSRSKDGDPDNIFFCEDTSYFRLGENALLTSLTTDTCDFVLLSAMALKAPRLEICQKCVTQCQHTRMWMVIAQFLLNLQWLMGSRQKKESASRPTTVACCRMRTYLSFSRNGSVRARRRRGVACLKNPEWWTWAPNRGLLVDVIAISLGGLLFWPLPLKRLWDKFWGLYVCLHDASLCRERRGWWPLYTMYRCRAYLFKSTARMFTAPSNAGA